MPLAETMLIIMALLTVAMVAAGLCRNLPIPFTVFLVVLGMVLASLEDTVPELAPLHAFRLTPDLVLFLFLPALVFESAFNLDARQLVKDLAPVLSLAVPALLVSTALVGLGLWLLLRLDLVTALLFGALISATDPVAVIALFRELGAPLRLTVLVEGESLLNDGTAIVVFNILLGLALAGGLAWSDAGLAIGGFFEVFAGGVLVGAVTGYLLSEVMRFLATGPSAGLVMTLVMAYGSFIAAEHGFHVSGVMAVVSAAITLGVFGVSRIPQATTALIRQTWEVIALVCNSLLFLLVGLSVNLGALVSRLDYILVAALLVIVARAAAVYSLVPLTTRLFRLPRISAGEQHIMWWGGLKGGLAIAIVLSIPESLAHRQLLVDMTVGVVLFSLLVNAPTIRPLIHWLGIDRLTANERAELRRGLQLAAEQARQLQERFRESGLISRKALHLMREKTEETFRADSTGAGASEVRHLYLECLRTEFEELARLHEIGLIQTYTFLDLRNALQRDREHWIRSAPDAADSVQPGSPNMFLRLEAEVLRRLRERNWGAGLLARYQNLRLGQRLQHDIAGILIGRAVLAKLDAERDFPAAQIAEVRGAYEARLRRRLDRLEAIRTEFPEFYERFETRFFERVALNGALHAATELHHGAGIGPKTYGHIARRVGRALANLPPMALPARALAPEELMHMVPLLAELPAKALQALAQKAHAVTFLPGDVVIGEGDRGDALYIITRGRVSVEQRTDDSGGVRTLAELADGDFFGETALLGDQVRTATVRAKTAVTLLRLTRHEVLALAATDPELEQHLREVNERRRSHPAAT